MMSRVMGGEDKRLTVGQIVGPQGLQGELKVFISNEWHQYLGQFKKVWLAKNGDEGGWREVERYRMQKEMVILKLSGIDDRNCAEAFRGFFVQITERMRPSLPSDTYYTSDVIGLSVRTTQGEKIGRVVDVLNKPGQDVYVVQSGKREILIPAVKAFIKQLNVSEGEMIVEPIEGLLD
jgi:16S rRNA processing protein RimM